MGQVAKLLIFIEEPKGAGVCLFVEQLRKLNTSVNRLLAKIPNKNSEPQMDKDEMGFFLRLR